MIKTNTTWYECPVNNTGHGRAVELKAHYHVKKPLLVLTGRSNYIYQTIHTLFILKKIATILLLALVLFNLVGYKLVFYYMQQQADRQLETSLDNGSYNEADLITIKIPLSNPYQLNHPEFERVDGEINVKGIIYKYVKRKICDGQLVLLCLPDKNKMRLQEAKNDFFKVTNDLAQHNGSKNAPSKNTGFKIADNDYMQSCNEYSFACFLIQYSRLGRCTEPALLSAPHVSPEQPPDML